MMDKLEMTIGFGEHERCSPNLFSFPETMTDAREQFHKEMRRERKNKQIEKYVFYLLVLISLLICSVCIYAYLFSYNLS